MKKWSDLFNEPLPPQFADRVIEAARKEMLGIQKTTVKAPGLSRWAFLGGLSAAALGAFIILNRDNRPRGEEFDLLVHEDEMLKDHELMNELDTLEEWDDDDGEI